MSDHPDAWAAGIGLAVVAGMRALDWLMPKGWHLKLIRRWAEKDTKENEP